ncbi:neuralized-like protein 4 [Artemia franciscana]|uniref:neuralized-like protein 4 n=1 Tax=Artemia franciscana TaxID=6661 RepID=UPI0032DABF27
MQLKIKTFPNHATYEIVECVTLIRPEELDFPSTLTDIDYDTWMLSGSSLMRDGELIRNGYPCDLDSLPVGTRLGMARHEEGSLHYYVNGRDQGPAFSYVPPGVYAIIDLYGQCAQVSLIHNPVPRQGISVLKGRPGYDLTMDVVIPHTFSTCCGPGIILKDVNTVAVRGEYSRNALVCASHQLNRDENFEIRVESRHPLFAGSLKFGFITTDPPSENLANIVASLDRWFISGSSLYHNSNKEQKFMSSSFERLGPDDRVTMKRGKTGVVVFQVNGLDLGVAAPNHYNTIYPFVELDGAVDRVRIVSNGNPAYHPSSPGGESLSMGSLSANLPASLVQDVNIEAGPSKSIEEEIKFSEIHGRNICLVNNGLSAKRTASYNQGIVLSRMPIVKGQKCEVRIEKLTNRWNSSLMVGLVCQPTEKNPLPVTALGFRRSAWVVSADTLFVNGQKAKSRLPFNLDNIAVHSTVGLSLSLDGDFHILIDGKDLGKVASGISDPCYAVFDLYGQCEEIQLINPELIVSGYYEKADFDCSIKEKEKQNAAIATGIAGSFKHGCNYINICKLFKSFIGIPSLYFVPEVTCYCGSCSNEYKFSGSEKNSKDHHLIGWCRFPFSLSRFRENTPVNVEGSDRWPSAYYPAEVCHIRQLLDAGQLYPSDGLGLTKPKNPVETDSKTEEVESPQLVFYPVLPNSSGRNTVPFRYKKQLYSCQVAFQLLVQPGSYKVSENRKLEASSSRRSPTSELSDIVEWSTKEKGATVFQALLVKLEVNSQ